MPDPFPILFSPLRVGPVELKNRIVNSAHQTGFAFGGAYSPQLLAYHKERAAGGAALIMSQATCVVPDYLDLWNSDETIVESYRALAELTQSYGAHYFAELWHPGRQSHYTGPGTEIYSAPSAIPYRSYDMFWRVPKELDSVEIGGLIEAFRQAAVRCKEGGLSGINLHFAHGNLIEQFMWPKTNHRTDHWGGSLENRLRLAYEIALAVRDAVGDGLAVGARVTGSGLDADEPGEMDSLELVGTIASWGLFDFLDVTMGNYTDVLNTARNIPNMTFRPGLWAKYGKAVKAVTDVPVFLVGRINHPRIAEELLESGSCDAVVMARALIADPYLPAKAAAGRTGEIRPCVGAMNCVDHLNRGEGIRCVHNPTVGREESWGGEPAAAVAARRVVVIGGGPSGLECARVAAERGHNVTLLERTSRVGGQVLDAARAPNRGELGQIVEWLAGRCSALGVELTLGTSGTADAVTSLGADVVVLATGSRLRNPAFSGNLRVIDPISALRNPTGCGARVVVFDEFGDWQAMGVATALARAGTQIHFVTPLTFPGMALELSNWRLAYEDLAKSGVIFHPLSDIVTSSGQTVRVAPRFGGPALDISAVDALVAVMMPVPCTDDHQDFQARFPEVHIIGDARAPRGIEAAIYEGHALGRSL